MNLLEIKEILCPKCKGYAEQYRRDSIIGFKCSCGWDSNDGTCVLTDMVTPPDRQHRCYSVGLLLKFPC